MEKFESIDEVIALVMKDRIARWAYKENNLRWNISNFVNKLINKYGLSIKDFQLKYNLSPSQVKRILHKELGDNLYLGTIVKVADYFGYDIKISFIKRKVK